MENPLLDYDDDGEDDFYSPMLKSTLRYRKVCLEYTLRDMDQKEENNDPKCEPDRGEN